jgi:hypothetical protein
MDSLKFENTFNNKNGNSGDLFQTFVYELLKKSDYPKLHRFQTAGKDGGIDLIQQLNGERTVIECKYIGDNDIDEAKKRWKTVKNHLETQLATQPPKEKQYKPWLKSDTPITTYLFCVSSNISNQNGFDEFEKDITDCFKNLAVSHPHLKHLENINVEIIDWSKLLQKLDKNLPLKFKWFPLAEKFGFIPIQNKSSEVSFRTFLEEESLPFYNRSKHLEKEPNAEIQSEEQLLEMLEDSSLHGHIITGNGGTGKTRLTFELGRLAFKNEWLVFRCKETVNADNLTKFAETIADDKKILLLMDYVETQKHFTDITEQVSILNDSYGFQIKYVANCRSSYYPTIRSTPNHHQVLLTSSSEALWLEQYQASVVRHILEQGGIQIEEKHLAVCKNKPILAVFLLYLHQKNQGEELESLLDGADFGKWIQKRTKMSFVNVTDFELKLAKLAAMLPFSEDVTDSFDEFNTKLLGILANDGWIEKFQSNEWRSVHDVFADQIILSYTQDNPHFVEKFIRDIFSFAYSTNCLGSAFITIQRLAPYLEVDFNKLLNAEIDKDLPQWKKIRNYLLETSLLQEGQKLDLLSNEVLWGDAETDRAFQIGLAGIIRTIEIPYSLSETQRSIARYWLRVTIENTLDSNLLLNLALKFSPEDLKDLALTRMQVNSDSVKTRRLFRVWIKLKLPLSDIKDYFGVWLVKHQTAFATGFDYRLWLYAKGEPYFVKESIRLWLAKHQTKLEAGFIFKSWLDANGDIDFIKEPFRVWLLQHHSSIDAGFNYKSWLDMTGEPDFVEAPIRLWLAKFQTNFDAGFIYKSWLEAKGDIGLIREPFRLWLAEFRTALDAGFNFRTWLDAKGDIEVIKEHIASWLAIYDSTNDAGFIYRSWLNAEGDTEFIREHLKRWLVEHQTNLQASFIYQAWLNAKGDTEFIREHLKRWLVEHQTNLQASFIYQAWLNAKGDTEFIKEYLREWLLVHQTNFDTNFVFQSWLASKGDTEFIKEGLREWLLVHQTNFDTSFVYQSWLKAKGDTEFIKEYLREWLLVHQTNFDASFVYQSWLKAKGDTEFIGEHLRAWLKIHETKIETYQIYRLWISAKEESAFVQESLSKWLAENGKIVEARFVYSELLNLEVVSKDVLDLAINWLIECDHDAFSSGVIKQLIKISELPIKVIRYILIWCSTQVKNKNVTYILASIKVKELDYQISNKFLIAAEIVIDSLLLKDYLNVETKEQVTTVFFNLFSNKDLQDNISIETIEQIYVKWIKYQNSFGENQITFSNAQTPLCLERFAIILEKNLLNINNDRLAIERFLHHFNNWLPENRQQLQPIIKNLRTKYPSDMWEIVKFEE